MKEYHCAHAEKSSLNIPPESTANNLATFFKVFGDSTRIKLLFALLDDALCVHDLALMLDMEQSAISHQLRYLRQNKLVRVEKRGKSSYYSLDDSHISEVLTKGLDHISHP